MDPQPLADAVADRRPRVERRERVLEDDLHPAPVRLQGRALQPGDVRPVEQDLARRRVDEPEQQPADGRLAAARLADEAERLAPADLEAHAVDGLDEPDGPLEDAALDREVLDQVADDDERLGCQALARVRGAGDGRDRRRRRLIRQGAHVPAPTPGAVSVRGTQPGGRGIGLPFMSW